MIKLGCVLFFLIISTTLFSQHEAEIKSYYEQVAQAKEDTNKVRLFYLLSVQLKHDKRYDEQGEIHKKMMALSQKLNYKLGIATVHLNEGERLALIQKNQESINEYLKCLSYFEKHKPAVYQSTNMKIGRLYYLVGDYPSALQYCLKALKIAELLNDEKSIGMYSGNIGNIYKQMKNEEKALEYYLKALNIAKKNDSKQSIAVNLIQIGNFYLDQDQNERAHQMFSEALVINETINRPIYLANNYLVLAQCEIKLNQLASAKEHLLKSKNVYLQLSDFEGLTGVYIELAKLMEKENNYEEAKTYALDGLNHSIKYNYVELRLKSLFLLSEISEKTSDYKNAYLYYSDYVGLNDSVFNIKQQKLLLEKELNFTYEKKQALAKAEFEKAQALNRIELERKKQAFLLLEKNNAFNELQLNQSALLLKKKQAETEASNRKLSLLKQEKLLQEAYSREKSKELSRQKTIRNAFVIGSIFMLFMALFIFRSLKKSKSQNRIIEEQKLLVEKQKRLVEAHHTDIVDSITYAKRIQQAILPSVERIYTAFSDIFVFYQPKDIVAGDFYWMEQSGDLTFFAVSDSTGHGVPGALVSVVCSNALNRAVLEFGLTEPGEILDKTRELVLETFSKNGEEIKDGMDTSLCVIDRKNAVLKWSGANNPLWYLKNDSLVELKPNKQAIGKVDNPMPFTTHQIPIDVETQFFLFTDGYADQFGGEKGKKMKYKPFAELITTNRNEPMEKQFERLKSYFNDWKGSLEQVDDVCVVSFKLSPNHK